MRIGPNAVSFYSLDVYDIVYGTGSRFRKDPRTYGEFVQGCPALFSITFVSNTRFAEFLADPSTVTRKSMGVGGG